MILIRNGTIVDGTGRLPYKADVLVRGDRIAAIGNFPRKDADVTIDALGLTIAPGLIDVDTESDHYLTLMTEPDQEDFLRQGVTTIVGGLCGASLAPLLYGTLESIRKWADPNAINVSWHTFAEFRDAMERRRFGVNFASFAGHATIRRAILGNDLRDLTEPELKVFRETLRRALREGALGLSTGLAYSHSRGTPYRELRTLAEVVKEEGGVYATHLRSEHAGLLAAVRETVQLAEDVDVPVVLTHYRPFMGHERDYERGLKLLTESNAGSRLYFDNAPTNSSTAPLYRLLPIALQRGSRENMHAMLRRRDTAERILGEFRALNPDDIVILRASGAGELTGKTLAEFSRSQGLDAPRALLRLMDLTALRGVVLLTNVNLDWAVQCFRSPHALLGSNQPNLPRHEARRTQQFRVSAMTNFLGTMVGLRIMGHTQAIERVTRIPAALYRIPERGLLKEGMVADIAILRGSAAVHVIVSGTVAVVDGALQGVRSGRFLTRAT